MGNRFNGDRVTRIVRHVDSTIFESNEDTRQVAVG